MRDGLIIDDGCTLIGAAIIAFPVTIAVGLLLLGKWVSGSVTRRRINRAGRGSTT